MGRGRIVLIAVAALAFAPASSHAATLAVNGTELEYAAAAGDFDNSVRFVEVDPDTVRVTHYARSPDDPITPGPGCNPDPLTTADDYLCDGVAHVTATSDDGRDYLWAWAAETEGSGTRYEHLTTIGAELDGGAGNDYLRGGNGNDSLDAGPGNDTVEGFWGNDAQNGGTGSDWVAGHYGNDRLSGDAGWDALHGGPDNDLLLGGDGTDELEGSTGDDVIGGGEQVDVVAYEGAWRTPLDESIAVSLDDVPGDGREGERDNVLSDVENVRASSRDDVLTDLSGSEANSFEGFGGNDLINPGEGEDTVDAGSGDDVVDVRDASVDVVTCGDGSDTAYADERDTIDSDCERVNPRVPAPEAITTPQGGGEPTATVDTRLAARGLLVRARPGRDRRAPFTFLIKGLVKRPSGTAGAVCGQGRVSIAVSAGRRVLTAVSEEVKPNCTFGRWFVFRSRRHFPRSGRLLVNLRFAGSEGLKPGNKARALLRTR